MSKLIIQNAILPAFRRKDFPAGIKAGVRDISDVLLGDAEAVKQRARSTQKRDAPGGEMIMSLIIIALFISFFVWVAFRQSRYAASQGPGRRMRRASQDQGRGSDPVFIPGGWGGGSRGSGGSDGGGWSGGGGDFGGGGASGDW